MLHAAVELRDLSAPPGNRLEALKGKLRGRYSLRVNDQYRITFKWAEGNAELVQVEDYHQ
jgi:proteic killer suppression protein